MSQKTYDDVVSEMECRRAKALAMGGEEKLAKRKAAGYLNARERLAYVLDADSFLETGQFSHASVVPEDRDRTPADGKITGFGRIDGREIAIVANDFTVKGASSSLTNMKKIGHMKRVATERGLPLVLLGESSGARMPDNMGAQGMGTLLGNDPTQYLRDRKTPWVSALLGPCYGSSALYACMSDFVVMRKGASMGVSSPRLVAMATGEKLDAEELCGWRLHAEVTGLVDAVVESDEEALDTVRRFLSYMPAHHNEPPPIAAVPAGSEAEAETVGDLLPASRTRGYDARRVIDRVVDRDSMFELKPALGKSAVTALGRIAGRTVGMIANNPMFKGGALDVPACEKITSFLVLCDSYNIPLVMLVDTPGFLIGGEAERQGAPGKIINFMNALQLCTVPKLSVIMRKTYGQAYLNMGGGRNSDEVAAWPTAEVSFMDPRFAVEVVASADADEEERARIEAQMERESAVWGIAGNYGVQYVIRPEETRAWLERMLSVHCTRLRGGVGEHRLATWPTSF